MDGIVIFVQIGIFLFLIGLGVFVGRTTEKRHLRNLEERESAMKHIVITQLKSFPGYVPGAKPPEMLYGEVSIATDYLKTFFAKIRNIFGGEMQSYQTMLVRARREATLRILEEANAQGYNAVCNFRIETADVGGSGVTSGKKKASVMANILASATAYHVAVSAQ